MLWRAAVVLPAIAVVYGGACRPQAVVTAAAPAPVQAPVATPAAPAPAPAPPAYLAPVGGQYLGSWGHRLAYTEEVPHWFLLSATDLASYRYRAELGWMGDGMVHELEAVLDEGCRSRSCDAEVEHARASLRALDSVRFGDPRTFRWTTDDAVPEERRRFEIRGDNRGTSFDIACTCRSWTVGMGTWNDIAECAATLRDHNRVLLRYAPVTQRLVDRQGGSLYEAIDAYDQVVTFASGVTLTITSGYSYERGELGDPPRKGAPRGSLQWDTAPAKP